MLYRLHLLLLQEVFWGAATQLLKQHSICCTILQTHFLLMRNGFLSLVLESGHTLAAPSGKGSLERPHFEERVPVSHLRERPHLQERVTVSHLRERPHLQKRVPLSHLSERSHLQERVTVSHLRERPHLQERVPLSHLSERPHLQERVPLSHLRE